MHHRQQVGTVGHQGFGVLKGNAADHTDWQVQARAGLGQHLDGGRWGAGFGTGIEEATEGDVTGALVRGLLGQFDLAVAGAADDCLGAEQRAGWRQRAVGLAQVYADAQARGQFGVVVDNQLGLVARAQLPQLFRFAQAPGSAPALGVGIEEDEGNSVNICEICRSVAFL